MKNLSIQNETYRMVRGSIAATSLKILWKNPYIDKNNSETICQMIKLTFLLQSLRSIALELNTVLLKKTSISDGRMYYVSW